MSDQGSTYAVLQSVPVMVSPLYRLPKKIMVASELKMVPDDISKLPAYPFAVERDVIAHVEATRKTTYEAEEAFKLLKCQYEHEKVNQRKAAARKIAPGFLDTETRILKPEQVGVEFPVPSVVVVNEEDNHSVPTSPKMLQPANIVVGGGGGGVVVQETSPDKHFDYLKFEQGLAPADPWDTPENDMVALRSILGSSPKMPTATTTYNHPPSGTTQIQGTSASPTYSMPQQQYQQQHPRPYQKNEGVYWSFQNNNNNNNTNSMYNIQQQVPALPPKLFNSNNPSPMPTSSTSSPIISSSSSPPPPSSNNVVPLTPPPPPPPPPSDYHLQQTPPPLPPLPPISSPSHQHQQYENLILELCNMGFSKSQAMDALEKNHHDLMKATNFLLDQA